MYVVGSATSYKIDSKTTISGAFVHVVWYSTASDQFKFETLPEESLTNPNNNR